MQLQRARRPLATAVNSTARDDIRVHPLNRQLPLPVFLCMWVQPAGFYTFGKRMYGKQLSDYRRCWQCGKANSCEQG